MEIEIGDYVRTKDGKIGKFIRIEFDEVDESLKWCVFLGKDKFGIEREIYRLKPYIVAHSKNIIDLIEVGDFVNGNKVIQISKEDGLIFVNNKYYDEGTCEERHCVYKNNEIKTILTKEQYMNNCYKVEE